MHVSVLLGQRGAAVTRSSGHGAQHHASSPNFTEPCFSESREMCGHDLSRQASSRDVESYTSGWDKLSVSLGWTRTWLSFPLLGLIAFFFCLLSFPAQVQWRIASGFRFSKALKCTLSCIQCPLQDSGNYLLHVTRMVKGFTELEPQPPARTYSAAGTLCCTDKGSHLTALPSAGQSCSPPIFRIRIV